MRRLLVETKFTVDDAGAVEGIAWPFGTPDRVGDVIEKGAFTKAIGQPIPMLFAHDQRDAVGLWERVEEKADGLHVRGRLLVDEVERAREVRALMLAGAAPGLSMGFVSLKSAPRRPRGRTISLVDLLEISIVPAPCHPGALVTSVKAAASARSLVDAINRAASALRT